ncbi:MAG: NAD(+)/NADH kinase [Clostridia bacterium]|nr:NAD(+)/NADH kinase [Clostridia bacterium]
MEFRKIGLIWNPTKTSGFEVARELRDILAERGLSVTTGITLAHALGAPELAEGSFEECDLLMVLGGDGTLLSALDYALPKNIPMLGINLGRMGFMTEVDPANLRRDVSEVLNGNYTIDSRMTLTVAGQNENNFFALNDIVLTRSTPSVRILSLEIEVNGIVVDRISGDGLIVATATGSTAYSLSAGGPIIRPGLDCLVITPICPHTLNTRPVVVSSNDVIKIRVMDDRGGAQAVMDGRKVINVPCGEPGVTILRSELRARFIRLHDRNYFSLLRDKLSEWTH